MSRRLIIYCGFVPNYNEHYIITHMSYNSTDRIKLIIDYMNSKSTYFTEITQDNYRIETGRIKIKYLTPSSIQDLAALNSSISYVIDYDDNETNGVYFKCYYVTDNNQTSINSLGVKEDIYLSYMPYVLITDLSIKRSNKLINGAVGIYDDIKQTNFKTIKCEYLHFDYGGDPYNSRSDSYKEEYLSVVFIARYVVYKSNITNYKTFTTRAFSVSLKDLRNAISKGPKEQEENKKYTGVQVAYDLISSIQGITASNDSLLDCEIVSAYILPNCMFFETKTLLQFQTQSAIIASNDNGIFTNSRKVFFKAHIVQQNSVIQPDFKYNTLDCTNKYYYGPFYSGIEIPNTTQDHLRFEFISYVNDTYITLYIRYANNIKDVTKSFQLDIANYDAGGQALPLIQKMLSNTLGYANDIIENVGDKWGTFSSVSNRAIKGLATNKTNFGSYTIGTGDAMSTYDGGYYDEENNIYYVTIPLLLYSYESIDNEKLKASWYGVNYNNVYIANFDDLLSSNYIINDIDNVCPYMFLIVDNIKVDKIPLIAIDEYVRVFTSGNYFEILEKTNNEK